MNFPNFTLSVLSFLIYRQTNSKMNEKLRSLPETENLSTGLKKFLFSKFLILDKYIKFGIFIAALRPFEMYPSFMSPVLMCAINISLNIYLPSDIYYKYTDIHPLSFFPNENVKNRLHSNSNHTY